MKKETLKLLLKYAQAPVVSQTGTTELFFGDDSAQKSFTNFLNSFAPFMSVLDEMKDAGLSGNVNIQFIAEPGKGAKVDTDAQGKFKSKVLATIAKGYSSFIKKNLDQVRASADAAAKKGSGSGLIPITFAI